MTVSKDVVVAVKMMLHVTNRLVIVNWDAKQDLLTMIGYGNISIIFKSANQTKKYILTIYIA